MKIEYRNVYFIGIGGIGMSAIARFFKFQGCDVSGYDRTPSDLTRKLESEGIRVHYEDRPEMIPADISGTLVVYTPAIPEELGELRFAREKGYTVIKRSKTLGEITRGQSCLAVAGSHGKTTTSTLIAHIMQQGRGCSAFLGGISKNYGTNMLMSEGNVVVAEADEFDRSFLQLHPSIAAITAMDADHLDIYGTLENMQGAFREFASQVSETLVLKLGLPIGRNEVSAKVFSYHFDDPGADFHASNLRLEPDGHYIYDLVHPGGILEDIRVGTLGWVNVENSIAAAAVCLCYGVDAQIVRQAIGTFQGVVRRMDERFNRDGVVYIDDYAHHPAELGATISSLRQIFPDRKLTAVFQPHLYTRTRDFADEFARSLSLVDELVLLDIYPARELPIEGVSSRIIFDKVTAPEKTLIGKDELMPLLEKKEFQVLVTFGAGDIDRFTDKISEMLEKR
ncbi:MAG: UDP-N-acetylmuramate--L-alanine ligase [Bacteroidales bacterium]|nr:UDP-N-acetylmuramate--L-alanine ligase [Bacteroidales bacterium]